METYGLCVKKPGAFTVPDSVAAKASESVWIDTHHIPKLRRIPPAKAAQSFASTVRFSVLASCFASL